MTKTYLINELKKVMEDNEEKKKLYKSGKNMNEARKQLCTNIFIETRVKLIKALSLYAKYGTVRKATEKLKMSRKTILHYRNVCPAYNEMWEEAHESYLDSLEEVADERAKIGSDTLLKFLLRAGRKEKYNEINNQINIDNTNNNINPETVITLASQIAKEIIKEQGNINRRKIPTVIETEYKEVE